MIETITSIRLKLDSSLAEEYERQARQQGKDVEELIAQRLHECKDINAYKGRSLTLSPGERQDLETALSRSFTTGREVVHYITRSYEVSVDGVSMPLSPELLRRLKDRCGRKSFPEFVREVVTAQLEHYAGMR